MKDFQLFSSFKEHSDSLIIDVSTAATYSYEDFYAMVSEQAAALQSLEIPKNSIIVIYGFKSTLKSMVALFACMKADLIPYIVEAGSFHKIADLEFSSVLSQDAIKTDSDEIEFRQKTNDSFIYVNRNDSPYIGNDNNLIVVSSSGSTSLIPKKILLGKKETMANIDSNQKMLSITKKDTTLLMLPISYSYGLIAQVFTHLYVGANIVIGEKSLSVLQLSTYLKKYDVTNFFMTPLIARLLLYYNQKKFSIENNLKFVTIGGDKPYQDTVVGINKLLNSPVYSTYGLAEAGPRVSTNKINFNAKNISLSIGDPNPETEVEIVMEAKYQELCNKKEIGYLKIKSQSIYLGYINGNKLNNSLSSSELITKDIVVRQNGKLNLLGRENEYIQINNKPVWFYNLSKEFYKHTNILKIKIVKTDSNKLNINVFFRGKINIDDILNSIKSKYNLVQNVDYTLSQIKFNNDQYK